MKRKKILSLVCPLIAFGITSQAATIIDYNGTGYVTAVQNFVGETTTSYNTSYPSGTGRSQVQPYSETVALSPNSSVYSGPTFYGGWFRSGTDATGTNGSNVRRVTDNAGGDSLQASFAYYSSSGATSYDGALVLIFLKEDFSNLSGVPNLTFETTNPLSIEISSLSKAGVRWMVKDGSTIYVSNTIYESTGTFTLSSIGDTTWAVFDPTTNLDFSGTGFASHTFTDIQGVGFYAETTNHTTDAVASNVVINSFYAAAVPEPAVTLLFGLGISLILWRRHQTIRSA